MTLSITSCWVINGYDRRPQNVGVGRVRSREGNGDPYTVFSGGRGLHIFLFLFFWPNTSLWGVYSKTFIHRYNIPLDHSFTRLCMIFFLACTPCTVPFCLDLVVELPSLSLVSVLCQQPPLPAGRYDGFSDDTAPFAPLNWLSSSFMVLCIHRIWPCYNRSG